ncbi:MAG: type IV pili methyl-accepting chemotaxis transducer N-terminal domain-containing protein, partial [Flavobacteriales bacterium]
MTKNGNSLDKKTFDKLSRLYIFALSTIAFSVIISQILVRKHLETQQSDSTLINVAGRQRMLSQKLTKEIVSLSVSDDEKNRNHLKKNIKETLLLWQLSHNSLQKGNDSLGLPKQNSAKIKSEFKEINPVFDTILKASNSIVKKLEKNSLISIDELASDIK